MTIYGFDQGYYFYAKKTSDADFTVGEILDLQNADDSRANANLMYWYLTAIEDIEGSNVKKYKIYPIRKSGDNTGNYVMYPDFRLLSSMFLVGLASGAKAQLRGPYLGGRILTDTEASGNLIVTIGESDYEPTRHDLFTYQDDTKVFVTTQGDPFNANFMSDTPFSAETLNYSCVPILDRQELAVPYVGVFTEKNRCGGALLTPWHVVTANHYPINAVETQLTFYNQASDTRITKGISGSLPVSWYDIYANLGITWLKNNAGATNEEKYLWTHQTLTTYYSQNYGSDIANRFLEGLNDLRVLLLNSAVSLAVKPAKLPKFTDDIYSKLGYGIIIDQNQRGYLTPLKDNVANQSVRPTGGSSVLSQYASQSTLPNGTRYGDIFRNIVSGDSSSLVLSSYAGETIFLGTINGASSVLEPQINVVDGLPTTDVPLGKSNPAGSTYENGCKLWMYLGIEIPVTVLSDEFPNPWYQNQDLVDNPASYPPFILDLYNQPYLTDFPDVLRNPFAMIQTYINNWSRSQIAEYPSTDVEFDVIDIVDDCPWFPCPDWKYYYRTSVNQSVVAADLFQYDRAPRERVNLGTRRSPITTTRIFDYSTNPGSQRASTRVSPYYALVRINDEDATGFWNGWGDKEVALYRGNPATGTRAYAWESNPAVPSRSSPWHNIIYEHTIGLYSWGFRSFMLHLPYSSLSIGSALTYENMVNEYDGDYYGSPYYADYHSTSDLTPQITMGVNYPSRWKGFFESLEALALGQMYPEGKEPISEPTSVMIYLPSLVAPNTTARTSSQSDYERLGETEWLRRIDSLANRFINLHNKVKDRSRFAVAFDSVSNSHTPNTSSDVFELGDWRLLNTLKQAGVNVYVTPRPNANSEWADFDLWSDEYDLFVDAATEGKSTDKSLNNVMRGAVRRFPIPSNLDPYGTLSTVKGSPLSSTENQRNTPHYALFSLYALSDHYREDNRWEGYKFIRPSEIMVDPVIFTDAPLVSIDSNGKYLRIPAQAFHSRTAYDEARIENAYCEGRGQTISGYSAGYWFPDTITEWDVGVRRSSISEFVDMIENFTDSAGPINTSSQNQYPNDTLSTKIIPSVLKEPFRPDLYTVVTIPALGDLNNDNTIDARDLAIVLQNFASMTASGDVNGSGYVDAADLSIILSNWGQTEEQVTTCTAQVISDPVHDPSKSANYEIFGVIHKAGTQPNDIPFDVESIVSTVFPGLAANGDTSSSYNRAGITAGLSEDRMNAFAEELLKIPSGRRVIDPRYWGWGTMSLGLREYEDYYKNTTDKITYSQNDSSCVPPDTSDPNTADFVGPWQENNANDTEQSWRNFLIQCSNSGLTFDYISDDVGIMENGDGLLMNTITNIFTAFYGPQFDPVTGDPIVHPWMSKPDARRFAAIVRDSRFTSQTNTYNGRTFADNLVYKYKQSVQSDDPQITHLTLMSPFICPQNYVDFVNIDYVTLDLEQSWDGCVRDIFVGERENKYRKVLEEFPDHVHTKYASYQFYPSQFEDARFVLNNNGKTRLIPWPSTWTMSPVCYAEPTDYFSENFGIKTSATTEEERKTWFHRNSVSPNDLFIPSRQWIGFLQDIARVRMCAKNTPNGSNVELAPWIIPPGGFLAWALGEGPAQYIKEHMFHICLHGTLYFNVWANTGYGHRLKYVDSVLKEWKTISGNSRCQPEDRKLVDLVTACTKTLISGGKLMSGVNSGLYLWRITIPPHLFNENQSTNLIPSSELGSRGPLVVPQGEVGLWILDAISTPPQYEVG